MIQLNKNLILKSDTCALSIGFNIGPILIMKSIEGARDVTGPTVKTLNIFSTRVAVGGCTKI